MSQRRELRFGFRPPRSDHFNQHLGCIIAQHRQFHDADHLRIDPRRGSVSNWDNLAVDYRISAQAEDEIIHRPPEYADIRVDARGACGFKRRQLGNVMTSSKLPNNQLGTRSAASETKPEPPLPRRPDDLQPVELPHALSSPSGADKATSQAHIDGKPAPQPAPAASERLAEERDEILNRIAAFRNLQTKLRQDREKYYDQTLARTRSLLSEPVKPRR